MKRILIAIFALLAAITIAALLLVNFDTDKNKQEASAAKKANNALTIEVIPYDDFTQAEAEKLAGELSEKMTPMLGNRTLQVKVMPNEKLPSGFRNYDCSRFRADSIIHSFEREKEPNVIKLGVTHHDISTSVHNISDFGVLGLSIQPGHSAVISTHRVHPRSMLWKVAVHEVLHCIGLRHCSCDNPECYMKDAKKHPKIKLQKYLCPTCDSLLQKRLESYK